MPTDEIPEILEDTDVYEDEPDAEDGDDELDETQDDAPDGEDEAEPAETPEDASSETTEDAPADDLKEKAELLEKWQERFARDPVGFLKTFAGAMTPEQQAAFLAEVSGKPAEPDTSLGEAQSEIEEDYLKNRKAIQELPTFARNVEQNFQHRDTYINDSLVRVATLEAQLAAVLEYTGLALPTIDRKAVDKTLAEGKLNYTDAVKAHYEAAAKKAVVTAKQATKPRPTTPANSSGRAGSIPKDKKDMLSIWRHIDE